MSEKKDSDDKNVAESFGEMIKAFGDAALARARSRGAAAVPDLERAAGS